MAVVWFERWAACVYGEFSVPEAMSLFAEPSGLVLCRLRANQCSDSYFPSGPLGVELGSPADLSFLCWTCALGSWQSLHPCEKSGQLLFLIALSCIPEREGSVKLGVCWGQTSPALWHGHSSGPWLLSHVITAVWD